MKIKEYLDNIILNNEKNFDFDWLKENIRPLCVTLDEAKKVFSSIEDKSIFFDDDNFYRLLSRGEIINCEEELSIKIKRIGIIPCIDCGDNDFICYNLKNSDWCKYNIVDGANFSRCKSILNFEF